MAQCGWIRLDCEAFYNFDQIWPTNNLEKILALRNRKSVYAIEDQFYLYRYQTMQAKLYPQIECKRYLRHHPIN